MLRDKRGMFVNSGGREFEDMWDGSVGRFNGGEMTIEMDKDASVISQRPYRLPDTLQDSNKQQLNDLLQAEKSNLLG